MKPTKRQIQIAEHWIKNETKRLMNEADYNPNSKEYKLKFLQDSFKALYDYSINKEKNLDPNFIINSLNKIIKSMEQYKLKNNLK